MTPVEALTKAIAILKAKPEKTTEKLIAATPVAGGARARLLSAVERVGSADLSVSNLIETLQIVLAQATTDETAGLRTRGPALDLAHTIIRTESSSK